MQKKTRYYGTTGLFAQPIAAGLASHQKDIFDKSTLELLRLGTFWPDIAGADAAQNSKPCKLRYTKGTAILVINSTPSSALELQHMQPILLQRIAKIIGHRKIERIQLIQNG